ncbi:MAG: hypothetical protein WD512_04990, partial [Candidatus Paceibacterota bacterium]
MPKGEENAPKSLSKKYHTQFKLSNDGKKIAIVTNTKGKYRVYIYNIKLKTIKEIAKGGHQLLNRDMINNYPLIAWHPTKNILSVILYKNQSTLLKNYQEDGNLIKSEVLQSIPFVKDLNYNNDGEKIIFSVIQDGRSKLLLYHTKTKTTTIVLDDEFDKLQPRFSKDNIHIYYTSNKIENNFSKSSFLSIYKVNILTLKTTYLFGNPDAHYNCYQPIELDNGFLSYLSDKNGIVNNYFYHFKNQESLQMTNYKRSIHYNDISISSGIIADLLYFNNRFRIYVGIISENTSDDAILNSEKTDYRKLIEKDIPLFKKMVVNTSIDSLLKDVSMNIQKDTLKQKIFISGFTERDDKKVNTFDKDKSGSVYKMYFKNRLGVSFFLQQFDNSILNNYLFPSNVQENVFNYPLVSPVIMTSL